MINSLRGALLASTVIALTGSSAHAYLMHGTGQASCSHGVVDDGCLQSPSFSIYTIQHTDFYDLVRQSGQAPYAVTAPWDAAGVNYRQGMCSTGNPCANGHTINPSALADPWLASAPGGELNTAYGCYHDEVDGPFTISCVGGAMNLYWGGYDLDNTVVGCVGVYIYNWVGDIVFENNHLFRAKQCEQNNPNGVMVKIDYAKGKVRFAHNWIDDNGPNLGAIFNGYVSGDNVLHVTGITQGSLYPKFAVNNNSGGYDTLAYATAQLGGTPGGIGTYQLDRTLTIAPGTYMAGSVAGVDVQIIADGDVTVEGNVLKNIMSQGVVVIVMNSTQIITERWNYGEGLSFYSAIHSEFITNIPQTTNAHGFIGYNTFWNTSASIAPASALIMTNSGQYTSTWASFVFQNNLGICNLAIGGKNACNNGVFWQSNEPVANLAATGNYVDPTGARSGLNYMCLGFNAYGSGYQTVNLAGNVILNDGSPAVKQSALTGGTFTPTTITASFASTNPFHPWSSLYIANVNPSSWNSFNNSWTSSGGTDTSITFPNTGNAARISGGVLFDGTQCWY